MREYRIALMDPTGNITLLVESPVPADEQPVVAARLAALFPGTEQTGFLYPGRYDADIALRMAGGEFCGNAAMSAGALHAMTRGEGGVMNVRVYGTAEPVRVDVTDLGNGAWRGAVDMPRPVSVRRETMPGGGEFPVVRFDGIAHVIVELPMDRPAAEKAAPAWCERLHADAVGLMFLDRAAGALAPLVYVPAAGTLCWERSCASGTTACGAYLAAESGGEVTLPLRQPGGTLTVTAAPDAAPRLTGAVRCLRRETAAVEL